MNTKSFGKKTKVKEENTMLGDGDSNSLSLPNPWIKFDIPNEPCFIIICRKPIKNTISPSYFSYENVAV